MTGEVLRWDAAAADDAFTELPALLKHGGWITALEFASSGGKLFTGDSDLDDGRSPPLGRRRGRRRLYGTSRLAEARRLDHGAGVCKLRRQTFHRRFRSA